MCDKKYIIEFLVYISIIVLIIITFGEFFIDISNFKQIIIRLI
ncbi:hypothetical protein CLK_A0219 (plasmid) [Clostridium botulinum A3 str. Loch Maree]|nr:hypothetical protein CLK_A0219 [Clostridium botulinum A3 str. Loch Maree]